MAHRQGDINDLNLQVASGRIPPSWSPDHDRSYPFRFFVADLKLWSLSTDLDPVRQGPAVALRLGGAAKSLARDFDPVALSDGTAVQDPATGNIIRRTGLECLVSALERRFAPLEQELEIFSISEFLQFHKLGGEGIDESISRYEQLKYRAEQGAQFQMTPPGQAWLLLNGLKISNSHWPGILAQTAGRLPATDFEYQAMCQFLRRSGHLTERSADPAKNLAGGSYYSGDGQWGATDQQYFAQDGDGHGVYFGGSGNAQTAYEHYEDSSGNSNPDEPINYQDCGFPDGADDNAKAELVYLQYRQAKRRWRNYSGPSKGRRKGKGKGKGKSKSKPGKSQPWHRTFFGQDAWGSSGIDWNAAQSPLECAGIWAQDDAYDDGWAQFSFFGKGNKGSSRPRGQSPLGRDGTPLRCSICDATDHFRVVCPKRTSTPGGHPGKGSGKSFFAEPEPQQAPAQFVAPSPNPMSQAYDNAQGWYFNRPVTSQPTLVFSDGTVEELSAIHEEHALMPTTPAQFKSSANLMFFSVTDTPESKPIQNLRSAGYYTWLSPAYHLQVRLSGAREGLLVDVGAIGNLCGSRWAERVSNIAHQHGQGASWTDLDNALNIQGVGTGSNSAKKCIHVPVAVETLGRGVYVAPVVEDSDLPALWGLESLTKLKAIIDTSNRRLIVPGPSGYSMHLSPGSTSLKLERAASGHLLLPCTEWSKLPAASGPPVSY